MADSPESGLNFTVEPPSEAAIEAGRLLFADRCDFIQGAPTAATLPPETLPEIAFAGRSNVGKSSLLNALTGRTSLARVSNTPGRTREINFFNQGGRLMLVDLPGYGFARAPKDMAEQWGKAIRLYLRGRSVLARVCLLIDSRHGVKESDLAVMKLMNESAVIYQIVLTKLDKITSAEAESRIAAAAAVVRSHGAAYPRVAVTSAKTGLGIDLLRADLAALAISG